MGEKNKNTNVALKKKRLIKTQIREVLLIFLRIKVTPEKVKAGILQGESPLILILLSL